MENTIGKLKICIVTKNPKHGNSSCITRRAKYGHHLVPNLQPLGNLVQDEFAALRPQGRLGFARIERSIDAVPMESWRFGGLLSLAYRRICVAHKLHLAELHYKRDTATNTSNSPNCGALNAQMHKHTSVRFQQNAF